MTNNRETNCFPGLKCLSKVVFVLALLSMNGAVARAGASKQVDNKAISCAEVADNDSVYEVVEQLPTFSDDPNGLMKYLVENVVYPVEAQRKGQQGHVLVSFIVEKDGSLSAVRITRQVSPLLDAEALRVVKAMPKWKPGLHNGKPVRVKYNIPVSFRLR